MIVVMYKLDRVWTTL